MHLDRKQSLSWARDSLSLLFLSPRSRAFSTRRGPAENCGAVRARAQPSCWQLQGQLCNASLFFPSTPPHGAQLLASCHTAHKASYHFAEIAPDEELPFPFSRGELPAACWQTAAVDWHFLRAFLSFYLPYSVAVFFFYSRFASLTRVIYHSGPVAVI